MDTLEILTAHPQTREQASALKAVMKALKIKFMISKEDSLVRENQLLEEIQEAVENLNLVKQGKLKARPAKELLHEL
ncbi:MAG: DUF2683 family protein [Mangrovibacterium sp.]